MRTNRSGQTTIFTRTGDALHPVGVLQFASEAELQRLVAENPDLIAAAIESEPGQVALVKREAGIPVAEGAADWFATDHLFVTCDGVPVIVEVKRASNTEIRRRIVGQMLDYAANATLYWTLERLQQWCERADTSSQAWFSEFVEPDGGAPIWEEMHANLAAGRFHLLFVADGIPPELRSVIDFLGRHLKTVHVAGAEIRQFGGAASQVVNVERVAAQGPTASPRNGVSVEELLEASSDDFKALKRLVESWAQGRGFEIVGRSRSFRLILPHLGSVMYLYPTYDNLEFRLGRIRRTISEELAESIGDRVAALPGGSRTSSFCSLRASEAVAHWDRLVRSVIEGIVEDIGCPDTGE